MSEMILKHQKLLLVSQGLTGKMAGIPAISSSILCNENCQAMRKVKGSICEHCYADRYLRFRKGIEQAYRSNTELLSKGIIPSNQLPYINATICRLETFGDLVNATHLENYIRIVRKNKHCIFSLFTKNYEVLFSYLANHSIPSNLSIVISSLMVNQPINLCNYNIQNLKNLKIFTVYTKEFALKNSIVINCGANRCLECKRCYRRNKNIVYINELIK